MKSLPVLVVDDSQVNRMITTKMLSTLGVKVLEAADGYQAIEVVKQNKVALIFMDIEMPGINGFETTKIIRKEKLSSAAIVGLSSHAEEATKIKSKILGMSEFLTKPVSKATLEKILGRFVFHS